MISELSTHLEGQLVAVHPAYDAAFDACPAARMAIRRRSARAGGGSLRPPGAAGARDLFRGAGMALFIVWPPISRFWMRPLPSWPGAGGRCWTSSTSRVDVC